MAGDVPTKLSVFDPKSLNRILQRVSEGLQIGGTSRGFVVVARHLLAGNQLRRMSKILGFGGVLFPVQCVYEAASARPNIADRQKDRSR